MNYCNSLNSLWFWVYHYVCIQVVTCKHEALLIQFSYPKPLVQRLDYRRGSFPRYKRYSFLLLSITRSLKGLFVEELSNPNPFVRTRCTSFPSSSADSHQGRSPNPLQRWRYSVATKHDTSILSERVPSTSASEGAIPSNISLAIRRRLAQPPWKTDYKRRVWQKKDEGNGANFGEKL
jgi:hypothetical protein